MNQNMEPTEVSMLPKILAPTCLILLMFFMTFGGGNSHAQTSITDAQPAQILTDEVISDIVPKATVTLMQSITPGTPCTILSYIPCNYLIPANDYVTFSIPSPYINLGGSCLAANLRTVTITFEAAPSVPVFVWLTGTVGAVATSTTPVYMTNASQTIYQTSLSTWFTTSATYNQLCVQAIYPSPPPTTLYYPMSCTVVYQ